MNAIFKHAVKVFLMLVLIGAGTLKAQFTNGNFVSGTPHYTIPGWNHNNVQYVATNTYGLTEDAWIDLTGTGFGAGRWIEQDVYTSSCVEYQISFDLSAWNGWDWWDAGVNVTIDGSPLGGRISTADFSGSPLSWHRMQTIKFMGSGTVRTFRFTCNSFLIQSYGDGQGVGVIGFDSVSLDSFIRDYQDSFELVTTPDGCNKYCFDINRIMNNQGGTISNIVWKLNGGVVQSGGMQYCKKFPKSSSPQTIHVEFDYTDEHGCVQHVEYTTQVTPDEDCGCDFDQNIELVPAYEPCDKYAFALVVDPDYEVECEHWTIDGVKVSDGSMRAYAPGHHKVCVVAIGHVIGEPDNACCGTRCYEFDIPEIIYETVDREYCELNTNGYELNPCDEFPGYGSFTLHTSSGGVFSGPCPSGSYLLGEGQHTLELFDADGCLRKVVTINVTRKTVIETICDLGIFYVECEPITYNLEVLLQNWLANHPTECRCEGADFRWFENGLSIDPNLPYMFTAGAPRTFTKVYYDRVNCRTCTYRFTVICGEGGIEGLPMMKESSGDGKHSADPDAMGHSYKIVPNPTASVFRVESGMADEIYSKVEIKDITGKLIISKANVSNRTYFDMSAYPSGSYMVFVTTAGHGMITMKLLTTKN